MKNLILGFSILLGVFSMKAKADVSLVLVPERTSLYRLVEATRILVREVQYAPLQFQVEESVYRFQQDLDYLDRCVRYNAGDIRRCHYELRTTNYSFDMVERYLAGSNLEFPRVYRAYVDTKRELDYVNFGTGPGPGPGPIAHRFRCVATDSGFEEHFGGHVAYGTYVDFAQRNALNECRRYHGRCRISRCEQVQ